MDISTLSTPTQVILALLLFALLLTWLIVFALMAFWPAREQLDDFDDQPTPASSFPVITVQSAAALSPVRVSTAAPTHDGAGYNIVKDSSPASTFHASARD